MTNCSMNNFIIPRVWNCRISHILFDSDIDNFNKSLEFVHSAVIDSSIDYIVAPNKKLNIDNNDIYLAELLIKNSSSYCNFNTTYIESLTFIECIFENNVEINKINTFTKINPMNIIINGYAYPINPEYHLIDSNKTHSIYFYNIIFSNIKNNLWSLGTPFLSNFKGILFDDNENKIEFYGNKFYNFTQFANDELFDYKPIISFFTVSVVLVIIVILLVLAIPYYLYRQRRRMMMEKLQYEVIYKKMDDISKEIYT
jgi:hypothetical protein